MPVTSLEGLIETSAQRLLTAPGGGERESLVYLGVWNESYPAILVRDPVLPDSAKVQLLYLMQEARAQSYGVTALPSVEQTCRDLRKSATTVVRDRAIMRMTRWISLARRVRDGQGRFRGSVFAVHGEPATLSEAVRLDPEYMALLEQGAAGHFDRLARRAALAVLAGIDHDIQAGRDPLAPVDTVEQRLEAVQALRGEGRFYSIMLTSGESEDDPASGEELTSPVPNFEDGAKPVPNFGGGDHPISKFESGHPEPTPKFETGPTGVGAKKVKRGNTVPNSFSQSNAQESQPETGQRRADGSGSRADYSVITSPTDLHGQELQPETGQERTDGGGSKAVYSVNASTPHLNGRELQSKPGKERGDGKEIENGNTVATPSQAPGTQDLPPRDSAEGVRTAPTDRDNSVVTRAPTPEEATAPSADPSFRPNRPETTRSARKLETGQPLSSSSYLIKTTTTETRESDEEIRPSGTPHPASDAAAGHPPLRWPPGLDDNLQRVVRRMLVTDTKLAPVLYQPVLDALGAKMRDKSDPIRNFGGYVGELIARAKAGTLNPVEVPTPAPARPPQADSTLKLNDLHNEIQALERMLGAAQRNAAVRKALEAQLAQRRLQLREMQGPTHH